MGPFTGETNIVEGFFNELSFPVTPGTDYSTLRSGLISSLKYLRSNGSVTKVRTDSASFRFLLETAGTDWNTKTYIRSMLTTPFENEDDTDDEYLSHTWSSEERECQGLAYAFLEDTVALSLDESPWRRAVVDILRDDECIPVYNVHNGQNAVLDAFFSSMKPLLLVKTELKPEEKKIHLRKDHGIDRLTEFSHRLTKSGYVIEVVNSLPFDSHKPGIFIKRCYSDGRIDILYPSSDMGIGVCVRTTGRNYRETKAIAAILKDLYSK